MAEKKFTVIIDGEEYVSTAADKAGKGMDKLTDKSGKWIKSFVDVKAAWDLVVQAGRALYNVANDSLAAFDEYERSMRKLEGTATITGTPLATLTELAAAGKREFQLSSVQANDYATAVNNLATKAGYAGDKQKLLGAMLDLGAAKGLSAAEALVAFEQSILGIDEGTDKLFGKNPSGLWADYADQIGKAPGKMNDLDKSLVLVYATMEAGGLVQGKYSEWLESSSGQQALLTNRINDGKVAFGELLSPVRDVVVQGLNQFIDAMKVGEQGAANMGTVLVMLAKNGVATLMSAWQTFGPTVTTLLKVTVAGVMFLSDATRALVIYTQEGVGKMLQFYGYLVEKGGKVLSAFGVQMVEGWGTTMRTWGKKMDETATESWGTFRKESSAAWASLDGDAKTVTPKVNAAMRSTGEEGEKAHKKVGAAVDATKAKVETYAQTVARMTKENEAGIKLLNEAWKFKTQAVAQFEKAAVKALDSAKLGEFKTGLDFIRTATDANVKSLMDTLPPLDAIVPKGEDIRATMGKVGDGIVSNGRAVLDLAGAFGVADQEAQVLLTSAMNLAGALPKLLAGDFTAVAGVVGAVGNMIQQITGGDAERRRLLNANNVALDRLRKDIGGLKLNITGEDFGKARTALTGVDLRASGTNLINPAALFTALQSQGLTVADLEKIGKELGIEIRNKDGGLVLGAVNQLIETLNTVAIGRVGGSFNDQLDFFRDTQKINGASGVGGLQALLDYVVQAGGAQALQGIDLTSPAGRQALVELFTSLNNGTGIGAEGLGRLTGSQLADIILEIITGLDGLAGSPVAPPPGTTTDETGTVVPQTPTGTVPVESPLVVIMRDYANAAAPYMVTMVDLTQLIEANTRRTADNTGETVARLDRVIDVLGGDTLANRVGSTIARDATRQALLQSGVVLG
jgi:hypothetical protein